MSMPVAPPLTRIPPDPALPPHQRNWHERFPCQDYVELAADLADWGIAVNATQATRWPLSRPPVRLWLRGGTGVLFVLAWDATSLVPRPRSPDIWDEDGRGMLLIDAFSSWGCYHPPGEAAGKVIWAQVPKPRA